MPYKDKDKQRHYQNERNKRARREWLEDNGPCVACGSEDNLEVDHTDPTNKVSHRIWSWSRERREAELIKCQVLCKSCHQTKTSQWRAETPIPHGTDNGYTKRECRCIACTEAHRVVKRAWRSRQRSAGLPVT